jgi:hypothetical protein
MPRTVRILRGSPIASRPLGWMGLAAAACLACAGQGDPIIPDHITVVAGADQKSHPYQAVADSLVVVLEDKGGTPVPNYPLTWHVLSGGGTLTPAGPNSDANGRAAAHWLLGGLGGPQTVSVTAGPGILANFVADAVPLVPDHVEIAGGNGQPGNMGLPLEAPLTVQVLDANDQPVPDVRVVWSITSGGGMVTPEIGNTDLNGESAAAWTLGATVGTQTLTARAGTLAALTFTATAAP